MAQPGEIVEGLHRTLATLPLRIQALVSPLQPYGPAQL